MDTRNKIVDWPQAEHILRQGSNTVVTGYFDPLLASHARRLAELAAAGPLVVVIADPPQPLLPARARAELVAALQAVEYVVLPPDGRLDEVLQLVPQSALVREEANDSRRAAELIERVRARQGDHSPAR